MLGQSQVVGIVVRRQIEGVGEDKRLKVQLREVVEFDREGEEVVEMLRRCNQRQIVPGSHTLTQNIGYLERQQRRRNDRLVCLRRCFVESDCPITSFLIENPLDCN